MGRQTPFYHLHLKSNAKMVDFAGWDMPLHFGSQIYEHHQVRRHVGLFDVSHMGIVDLHGKEATIFLRHLLANNVDRLSINKALYTCMLNDQGGILDDLIVYKTADDAYRMVINAGVREKDLDWIKKQSKSYEVVILERSDLAMMALQGPQAIDKMKESLTPNHYELVKTLKPFTFTHIENKFIARTGYTGEDGFEIILPIQEAVDLWQQFLNIETSPCGLGARDTLRLEAGLNLYGTDMDEGVTPLESNLSWTVAFDPKDRQFIGRTSLEKQIKQGIKHQLVGIILEGSGIIRNHQKVFFEHDEQGEVTSGGYSPTLEKSIALARIPSDMGNTCFIEIRNKRVPARVVKPPFVRHGKRNFDLQSESVSKRLMEGQ